MGKYGRNPPIVFLHGWTMEGCIFDDVVARLSDRFECFSPDLPGHGCASNSYPLTIDGAADFLRACLREHALEHPVLVGWSLGAMVAWNFARRFSEVPLAGIVSIDMSPKIINGDNWELGIRGLDGAKNQKALSLMQEDWLAYTGRVNANTFASGTQPHQRTHTIMCRQRPFAMAAMWQSLSQADERGTIADLPCPMLVISGARSRIYSSQMARFLVDSALMADEVVFENSGHAPLLEEPELFARVVSTWVERIATLDQ